MELYENCNDQLQSTENMWDVFSETPPEEDDLTETSKWVEVVMKVMKVIVYGVTLTIVLSSAVLSKITLLFMTSQVKAHTVQICKKGLDLERDKDYQAAITDVERAEWIWCLYFALIIPEVFTLFRSTRICIFKSYRKPQRDTFLIVFIAESLHALGLVLLVFVVLPDLDVVKAVMLTSCVCFIPGLFGLLSRHKTEEKHLLKILLDVLSLSAQATGFIVWPLVCDNPHCWAIPPAVIFVSINYWENFTDQRSPIGIMKTLAKAKEDLRKSKYYIYIFISIWKMVLILCSMLVFLMITTNDVNVLFQSFKTSFRSHPIVIDQIRKSVVVTKVPELATTNPLDNPIEIMSNAMTPIYFLIVHSLASWLCYVHGKFACRICIQGFSFAFPISLVIPVSVSVLIGICGIRAEDTCFFEKAFPKYLFWTCPQSDFFADFVSKEHTWIWVLWLLSQTWIAIHIWTPKCERLASTEKLFTNPMYVSALIDQSVALNRKRDDEGEIKREETDNSEKEETQISRLYDTVPAEIGRDQFVSVDKVQNRDEISKIYTCATMWHETGEEMVQMLKSVMRVDEDQAARKNAQKYLAIVDPDYYEFEVHIFFDDAFELCEENDEDFVVNRFVKQLLKVIDVAASNVHQTNIKLKPPKKIPTPYGGRLVWTMPGKNKLIAHLKDKEMIRHKKRWSQVMYMYYLLGHKLMELPISVERKDKMAENTYILALDGDINFRAEAVRLLVDLMKKNKTLGAACGRIHPVGSGAMVAYQKFEYAIGHWLQKATEHMIGCVLCSPGCFSLFRAKALMDDNVMRKYTTKSEEPIHYVQYDQGEDRWLCTLLLQRGYRVEYSAASDAYTHCPEGFGEFFTQRRRWAPSTMANILDLLGDYKRTVAINDNISFLYIIYQGMLMVGTVLGPGTIFLMLLGAMVAAFRIDNWTSFWANMIPILIFTIICFVAKNDIQILVAQILSSAYALLMMAVLVGTAIQLTHDGIGSPSAIFLIALSSSFLIAAILHPQEFSCIISGLLYFISVPSMYLLLILYSLVNLNVVSWGTREIQTKKTKQQLEQELQEQEEMKKNKKNKSNIFGWLGLSGKEEEEDGGITCNLANLFKCMFCTYPKASEEKVQLFRINDQLESLNNKIEMLERRLGAGTTANGSAFRRRSSIGRRLQKPFENLTTVQENDGEEEEADEYESEFEESDEEPAPKREDDKTPYWIEDKDLAQSELCYLDPVESNFFKELIEKYLKPLLKNKDQESRVAIELKELRNKVVFGFLMSNALFILIVFLLQLNKEQLHIRWPLGVKSNVTYIPKTEEVKIDREYLELEPIGLVFASFFAIILIVQFIGMVLHRFATFSHILASVELSCCNKKVEDISDDAFIDKNAIYIAKQLQRLRGFHDQEVAEDKKGGNRLERRRTIHNLEKRRHQQPRIGTLDLAFRTRLFSISEEGPATPVLKDLRRFSRRNTLRALERRRNTVVGLETRLNSLGGPMQLGDGRTTDCINMQRLLQSSRESVEGVTNHAFMNDSDDDRENELQMSVLNNEFSNHKEHQGHLRPISDA
ncbi:chitin synthase chs-2-like isoform X2 [Tachypleus tridentatus]|uniref:chitin synthase chs-2-like isoform X2 n=1 Tax=Tachypleus tridentatus TaxID=6853 RepID=UPI003FD5F5CC